MLRLCSWDIQYEGKYVVYATTEDQTWKPITSLVLQLIKNGVKISHGLCDSCSKKFEAELELERRREEWLDDGNSRAVPHGGRNERNVTGPKNGTNDRQATNGSPLPLRRMLQDKVGPSGDAMGDQHGAVADGG